MARLDAAALFVPTLMIELTPFNGSIVVNCEQATAAWIPRTVVDREAAVVRARSEFSMISDKPVSVILFRCITDNNPAEGQNRRQLL